MNEEEIGTTQAVSSTTQLQREEKTAPPKGDYVLPHFCSLSLSLLEGAASLTFLPLSLPPGQWQAQCQTRGDGNRPLLRNELTRWSRWDVVAADACHVLCLSFFFFFFFWKASKIFFAVKSDTIFLKINLKFLVTCEEGSVIYRKTQQHDSKKVQQHKYRNWAHVGNKCDNLSTSCDNF